MKPIRTIILPVAATVLMTTACAPEGSKRWCEKMANKPKMDWTANEAKVYAENCLFGKGEDG